MNAPKTRDPAFESDILAAVENLQREMIELATTLVRFPSLDGDEAGAQDFMKSCSATTDARAFNLYGSIPVTYYDPEAQNLHGIDESVSIECTLRVAQVLALFRAR